MSWPRFFTLVGVLTLLAGAVVVTALIVDDRVDPGDLRAAERQTADARADASLSEVALEDEYDRGRQDLFDEARGEFAIALDGMVIITEENFQAFRDGGYDDGYADGLADGGRSNSAAPTAPIIRRAAPALVPNGCSFYPDRPGGFDFKVACDRHDTCYGTWASFGSPALCDRQLQFDLDAVCRESGLCGFFAGALLGGLAAFGDGAYISAQCDGAARAGVPTPSRCRQ